MPRNREAWPDAVKIVACALVVIGHFTQSMVKSGFMADAAAYEWFQDTVYSFHVPLFFVCSGYLYQRYSRVDSPSSWRLSVRRKALALGVPYLFFTCATLALKALAGDLANTAEAGPMETLLLEPTAPYWYLYTLFFLFLVVPTAGSRRTCTAVLIVAVVAKALVLSGALPPSFPFALTSMMANGVWFALGMGLASLGWLERLGWGTAVAGLVFLPLSVGMDALESATSVPRACSPACASSPRAARSSTGRGRPSWPPSPAGRCPCTSCTPYSPPAGGWRC